MIALEAAGRCDADVIRLDVGLPGTDGYEVARRLRQRTEPNDALVVALTRCDQQEDRRRSREAGFDDHLVKPVSVQGVLCRHNRTLNSRLT